MNIPLPKNTATAALYKKPVIKSSELPTLLQRISTLLNEGYTFAHSIEMLLPYHVKQYEPLQQEISNILRGGGSVTQVFQLLSLDTQYLVSIELAEATGKLSEAIGLVAKQLVFQQQAKMKLIKVMSYPLILFTFLIIFFLAFRTYFLPNMSSVITSRVHSESSASIQWSTFFLHMPDYIIAVGIVLVIVLSIFVYYIRKKRIDLQLHLLFKLPLIGLFWRLFLTRQFARHLGNLLLAGFSLQKAFDHLKSQQHQKQIAYIAGSLQERILIGDSLERTVEVVGYFYPKFEHFIAHGEASGLLGRELILYCELLDEKLQKIIERILAIIQPLLFVIIAICVIAAYLSILIPMYDVIDFI